MAVVFNLIFLLVNVIGYYFGGLLGVGISFLFYYIFHFIAVKYIVFYKYGLYLDKSFYRVFIISLSFCIITFLMSFIQNQLLRNSLMIVVMIFSSIFAYIQLNNKIDIKGIIKNFIYKRNG
jgi:hypothetical protein